MRHLTPGTQQDATRAGRADTAAFASQQRYAAAVAARPKYTLRPGLTPEERLWLHTVASMPYEMALMVRFDPVVRSVGGAVVTVGAGTAGVAAVSEEMAGYSSLRWLGWQAMSGRFGRYSFLNYGFGQATRLSGLDDWHRSPQAVNAIGGLRYEISLRLNPRLATGLGSTLPAVLETGNRTAAGAVRKYGTEEAKKHLPK